MNITALWAKPPQTDQERYFANRVCDFLQKAWDLTGMDIRQIEILNICDLSIILAPKPFFDHMANHEKWARPEYWKMIKGAIPIFHAAIGRYFAILQEMEKQTASLNLAMAAETHQMAHSAFLDTFGYECSGEGVEKLIVGQMSGQSGWAYEIVKEHGALPIRIMQSNLGITTPKGRWEQKRGAYRSQNILKYAKTQTT